MNGDGLPDIVVTDQASGDVTVLLNDATHSFTTAERFRSGTSLYELVTNSGTPVISSLDQLVSLVAGNFTGNGRNDLVVVNSGNDNFAVLQNDGTGGFADPQPALTTSTNEGDVFNDQAGPSWQGISAAKATSMSPSSWRIGPRCGSMPATAQAASRKPLPWRLAPHPPACPSFAMRNRIPGFPCRQRVRRHLLACKATAMVLFQPPPSISGDQFLSLYPGTSQPDVLVANQETSHVTIQTPAGGGTQFVPVESLTTADPATQSAPAPSSGPYWIRRVRITMH